MLEMSFEAENKLEPEKKSELAKKLGLQPRQVAIWFQNRRARYKTKQLERDFDRLKSSYDSLLADHDSLLNDNLLLRSQILSLTEKLQAKGSPTAETVAGSNSDGEPKPVVAEPAKAEDQLSTGTVVDQEGPHHLVDSGDSELPEDAGSYDGGCGVVQSEMEEGSDVEGSRVFYFSGGVPEDQELLWNTMHCWEWT
ncbi:unnamed protein product [Spirodela intermedia]|uniref:Homeobox-leucine zipper protein n=1 Tax=Spirodela intermedia TaxID=51605 RepID=A0A7I8LD47_SPIIN|nr:unnamed protein product [Spirodela intermedia]